MNTCKLMIKNKCLNFLMLLIILTEVCSAQILDQQQSNQEYYNQENNQEYYDQQESNQEYYNQQEQSQNMYDNQYYNEQDYQQVEENNTNENTSENNQQVNAKNIDQVNSIEELNNNINVPFNSNENLEETTTNAETINSPDAIFQENTTTSVNQSDAREENNAELIGNAETLNSTEGYYKPATSSQSISPGTNQFSGALPVPGTRRELDPMEAPVEYIVKPGDTLYDICDQLVDEPVYWPKLWALNPKIRNPHFIRPGQKIRFFAGNDVTPPYLNVVEESNLIPGSDASIPTIVDQLVQTVSDTDDSEDEDLSFVDLGGDKFKVLSPDEISMPAESYFKENDSIEYPKILPIRLPGLVFKKRPKKLGVVIGGLEGTISSGLRDDFIVKGFRDQLSLGKTYMVMTPIKKVSDGYYRKRAGYFYENKGNIVLEQKLPGKKMMFNARATLDRESLIKSGDILVPVQKMKFSIPFDRSSDEVVKLSKPMGIASFDMPNQNIGSEGSLVYLNLDGQDIGVGQSIGLYNRVGEYTVRKTQSLYPKHLSSKVAIAKIIHKNRDFAIGYITEGSTQVIHHKKGYAK